MQGPQLWHRHLSDGVVDDQMAFVVGGECVEFGRFDQVVQGDIDIQQKLFQRVPSLERIHGGQQCAQVADAASHQSFIGGGGAGGGHFFLMS